MSQQIKRSFPNWIEAFLSVSRLFDANNTCSKHGYVVGHILPNIKINFKARCHIISCLNHLQNSGESILNAIDNAIMIKHMLNASEGDKFDVAGCVLMCACVRVTHCVCVCESLDLHVFISLNNKWATKTNSREYIERHHFALIIWVNHERLPNAHRHIHIQYMPTQKRIHATHNIHSKLTLTK